MKRSVGLFASLSLLSVLVFCGTACAASAAPICSSEAVQTASEWFCRGGAIVFGLIGMGTGGGV